MAIALQEQQRISPNNRLENCIPTSGFKVPGILSKKFLNGLGIGQHDNGSEATPMHRKGIPIALGMGFKKIQRSGNPVEELQQPWGPGAIG